MAINNWDRVNREMQRVSNADNIDHTRGDRHLSLEERKRRRIERARPREFYRRLGQKDASYRSILFRDIITGAFAALFFGAVIWMGILGIYGFFGAGGSPVMNVLGGLIIFAVLFRLLTRKITKRFSFMCKLKKCCKEQKYHIYLYRSPYLTLRQWSDSPDLSVETHDTVYEVMFMPSPRRLTNLHFAKEGEVMVVTGILKNKFKELLGLSSRVRVKKYGFDIPERQSKRTVKVLLLNPVPYELYCYDKKEDKIVQGGSGSRIFGYVAYSGAGFISELERN